MEKSPPDGLRAAIRRARIESAERSQTIADLRGAALARLEILQDALTPVFAEVPDHIDLFDTGLVPGEHPRLFVDMLAFVEMGRDWRTYRLLQDTRHGRIVISESERIDTMVAAVTDYVARRLIEREKALASDQTLPPPPPGAPTKVAAEPRRTGGGLLRGLISTLVLVALIALVGVAIYLSAQELARPD